MPRISAYVDLSSRNKQLLFLEVLILPKEDDMMMIDREQIIMAIIDVDVDSLIGKAFIVAEVAKQTVFMMPQLDKDRKILPLSSDGRRIIPVSVRRQIFALDKDGKPIPYSDSDRISTLKEEELPLFFLESPERFREEQEKQVKAREAEERERRELSALSCDQLLAKLREIVTSRQRTLQMAYEEGPRLARPIKEGIINYIKHYIGEAVSFQECDCEDAHNLREIRNLVFSSDDETEQDENIGRLERLIKSRETHEIKGVRERIMVDQIYYTLEGLLGFTKGERPSITIMDPEEGVTDLNLGDVL